MKKSLFILLAAIATTAMAQTITYEQIQNATDPKAEFQKEYSEYVASDGHTYKVGDNITIGMPQSNKTFAFMTSELDLSATIMGDGGLTGISAKFARSNMEIKQIKVNRNKKRGASVIFRTYLSGLGGVLVQIENCLASGEIVSQGMTHDKALEELKKAKDKLELDIITQEEYNQIKADLMPYLK
ncbi:MAG: SHOCT domain-containing protein [Paludibacteraceae bacterium]|nr:SHOCT domain-containing protein [Paludibacteraceae bacterium]